MSVLLPRRIVGWTLITAVLVAAFAANLTAKALAADTLSLGRGGVAVWAVAQPKMEKPFEKRELTVQMGPDIKMEFVAIDPGTFMMGLVKGLNGIERHEETIAKPFYMGKCEVTQEQWKFLMGDNPSLHKNQPKNPVEHVNWKPVQDFISKMNAKYAPKGMAFALPTEAQWEYACKAGATMRIGSTDDRDQIQKYGWIQKNSERKAHPVGQKLANKWGLYDMHGNVAEFCADNASTDASMKGPDKYIIRGGSFQKGETDCTSYAREVRGGEANLRYDGFRLICVPK